MSEKRVVPIKQAEQKELNETRRKEARILAARLLDVHTQRGLNRCIEGAYFLGQGKEDSALEMLGLAIEEVKLVAKVKLEALEVESTSEKPN
jgi:hypothetical protein